MDPTNAPPGHRAVAQIGCTGCAFAPSSSCGRSTLDYHCAGSLRPDRTSVIFVKDDETPKQKDPAMSSTPRRAKTSPVQYIIGTHNQLRDLLKRLEQDYPTLRWREGEKPSEWFDIDRSTPIVVLCLGPSLSVNLTTLPPGLSCKNGALACNQDECDERIREAYGPPKSKPTNVTLAWLRSKGACDDGIAWFRENFGDKASVNFEVLRKALAGNSDWIRWLDRHHSPSSRD